MSQLVGSTFRSRIPTLNDDASIEEALKVYHYGIDNYSTQPIPNDSIEGNFRTLTNNLNTEIAAAVKRISLTSSPNIITAQATNIVPITVRAIAAQTTPLQIWQDSASSPVAQITTSGATFIKDTLAIGSTVISTSSYLFVNQVSASIKGVIVKSAVDSTQNLQEWQNSSGTAISWVNEKGEIFSETISVKDNANLSSFMFMGS